MHRQTTLDLHSPLADLDHWELERDLQRSENAVLTTNILRTAATNGDGLESAASSDLFVVSEQTDRGNAEGGRVDAAAMSDAVPRLGKSQLDCQPACRRTSWISWLLLCLGMSGLTCGAVLVTHAVTRARHVAPGIVTVEPGIIVQRATGLSASYGLPVFLMGQILLLAGLLLLFEAAMRTRHAS